MHGTGENALEAWLRGEISGPVALMRMALAGQGPEAILRTLGEDPRCAALHGLARRHLAGLAALRRMVEAGADHRPAGSAAEGLSAQRRLFDRLAAISPEAGVAAYALGDPALLAEATAEIIGWLRGAGLLEGRPDILDLGCGIGRIAAALAPAAGSVLGLDLSPGMVAAARARCAGLARLRFAACSGRDLAGFDDASFDLVLAVDVFPYLVQADPALAARHVAEAGRVLRPGGSLVILNYGYRDPATDRAELAALARSSGLALLREGERPFALWDGALFWLRRG